MHTTVYIRTKPVLKPKTTHIQSGIPWLLFCNDLIGMHNTEVIFSLYHQYQNMNVL